MASHSDHSTALNTESSSQAIAPHDLINPTDNRPTQTRVRIRIPKSFHQEPILSHLTSKHGVTVNILAALLGANARDDGWFDLELNGHRNEIQSALTYLNELDLDIWYEADPQTDGW